MNDDAFQKRAEELKLAARAEIADEVRAIRREAKAQLEAQRMAHQLQLAAAEGAVKRTKGKPAVALAMLATAACLAAVGYFNEPELEHETTTIEPTWSGRVTPWVVLSGGSAERQLAKGPSRRSTATQANRSSRSRSAAPEPCKGDAFDPLNDCLR
jgi:hypothetical protein